MNHSKTFNNRSNPYRLRISGSIRQKYNFDSTLFAGNGRLVFADFASVRTLTHKLNATKQPGEHVYPGELFAAGIIHEAYHLIIRKYDEKTGADVFGNAAKYIESQFGKAVFSAMLLRFTEVFPPEEVFAGSISAAEYLHRTETGKTNVSLSFEELVMLLLANENPAAKKMIQLIDQAYVGSEAEIGDLKKATELFFANMPDFADGYSNIISMLRAPFLHSPDDFNAQLDYILEHWDKFLPEAFRLQILRAKDLMKEDYVLSGGLGAPPAIAPNYKEGIQGGTGTFIGKSGYDPLSDALKDHEAPERFTDDTNWMPRVVLIAKNTYVWLDQLSKKYQRYISRLDQIPDEELDRLADWHVNGLWLIGIWERSNASKMIKHLTGNTDAVASAYSLYDYQISADLGGEHAYHNLNERAKQRGIRLASDMVPNHTGVFSKWIVEHPDYFIQTKTPPFPAYRFTGENLSEHPDVEIRIEDGYYDKTDAAVVFRRVDLKNNDTRYIYHGNDGTMMPWNDTAQLDMIKAEVRKAVINKIFDVARKFSIIRFDAAMTLAKKHFARLWYPQPGSGGDIPSRADHAMSKEAFDTMFPAEFWREVVDRINSEMPETLLLAEAFWFMEGYFVRTLGMHRVYNSAFMHMLKNEENEKYRELIKNTLEYEPEILKRYVNFMSNPDEETAIQQFGTGDKYFGVCVLMNTLPGLPMFAHGQAEGFTEKYGMEYRRAYYNETPCEWLLKRHEREIFPLTKKRYLFSDVQNFYFFGFSDEHGIVNENVFAYTNCYKSERALVFYNNTYGMTRGHIKTAVPKLQKNGEEKQLVTTNLAEALMLQNSSQYFYIAAEHVSGMEYLLSGEKIHDQGIYREMMGFEYRVFLGFYEITDEDGSVATLHDKLAGKGTKSVMEALSLQKLEKAHRAFMQIFDNEAFNAFVDDAVQSDDHQHNKTTKSLCEAFSVFAAETFASLKMPDMSVEAEQHFSGMLQCVKHATGNVIKTDNSLKNILNSEYIASINELLILSRINNFRINSLLLLTVYALKSISEVMPENTFDGVGLYEKLMVFKPLENKLLQQGKSPGDVGLDLILTSILLKSGNELYDFFGHSAPHKIAQPTHAAIAENTTVSTRADKPERALRMLSDPQIKEYIGVNEYEGVWYYSKERFEYLNKWLFSLSYYEYFSEWQALIKLNADHAPAIDKAIRESVVFFITGVRMSVNAGYKLRILTEGLQRAAAY